MRQFWQKLTIVVVSSGLVAIGSSWGDVAPEILSERIVNRQAIVGKVVWYFGNRL